MSEETSLERRFVVDIMLGKMAKWLRILGFDTLCRRLENQQQIDALRNRGYILVTRNRRWCSREGVFCPTTDDPAGQIRELLDSLAVSSEEFRPLHRCILCNQVLVPIARDQVFGQVPDFVYETSPAFYHCPACLKIYWSGSHSKRMMERVKSITGPVNWDE
ncbi:MAG: Mut7-C RNAse domain-containing protein [Syntrophobacteraceae bacterium]|jgi:hypothetical protein|nr:Mut7-C RNAse domain-containing protein [Syntrophobacteraceae bacterium]